ncbi:MAG: hypothetical protein OXH73_02255 [Caldilineaceae bacterium]|nr:hypothetical protein [Caldilineaceae bacterium]
MAKAPELTDYVELIITLFEQYRMNRDGEKAGRPYIYSEASFIIFFMLMQYRRIFDSKSQWH